jgi:hypothetical protein
MLSMRSKRCQAGGTGSSPYEDMLLLLRWSLAQQYFHWVLQIPLRSKFGPSGHWQRAQRQSGEIGAGQLLKKLSAKDLINDTDM